MSSNRQEPPARVMEKDFLAPKRVLTSSAASSPESASSSSTNNKDDDEEEEFMEEPFLSTLSYIQEQRQRLDDDSVSTATSNTSGNSRFRCAPRVFVSDVNDLFTNDDDEPIPHHFDEETLHYHGSTTIEVLDHHTGSSHGSRPSSSGGSPSRMDLARRFLDESMEPHSYSSRGAQEEGSPVGGTNDDLLGFLYNKQYHNNNHNMWNHRSERGLASIAVDQSVNLMDVETASYDSSTSHKMKKHHLDIIKQKLPFLSNTNATTTITTNRCDSHWNYSTTPNPASDGSVLVEIDLIKNGIENKMKRPGGISPDGIGRYNYNGMFTCSPRVKSLVLLACFMLLASTLVSFTAMKDHRQKLPLNDWDQSSTVSSTNVSSSGHDDDEPTNTTLWSVESNLSFVLTESSLSAVSLKSAALEPKSATFNDNQEPKEKQSVPLLDTSNVPESSRFDAVAYFVIARAISDPEDVANDQSAVYQALQWIAEDDHAQLVIPGFDTTPSPHDWKFIDELLERYALAVLYFEMQVDVDAMYDEELRSTASDLELDNRFAFDMQWAIGNPICEWPGVTCDDQYKVVELNLTCSLLQGKLPREIVEGRALPNLSSLDLSHNFIRGALPSIAGPSGDIPATNALSSLYLNDNHITGTLEPLTELRNLTLVDLSSNRLVGTIPESISSLVNLENVFFDNNKLEGAIPTVLGQLSNITELFLNNNEFGGSVPDEICHLRPEVIYFSLAADCESGNITCNCCTQCF